jgi:hypothetical protein
MSVHTHADLRLADGLAVESLQGRLGEVEEVWLGPDDEPQALVVQRRDGRRGLLLADGVASVEPEEGAVFARPGHRLFELAAPKMTADSRLTASWTAADNPLPPLEQQRSRLLPRLHMPDATPSEQPLWKQIAILYVGIGIVVCVVMLLAFLIAWAWTGSAT